MQPRAFVIQLLRRPRSILVIAAAAAVVGWAVLRPDFRPDPSAVSAAVRQELAKIGFTRTQGVTAVRFETLWSEAGLTTNSTSEQTITPVDEVMTEKRTQRRATGLMQETSGLYVGPIAVVRFDRTKPPIIGDLLPSSFWSSSLMSRFVVEEVDRFPDTKGGRMRATVTYEDRYADGELLQTERRRLQCDVTEVVEAASIAVGLSGLAARVECREELQSNGRQIGASNPNTVSQGDLAYTHWYVLNRGWSIPVEGQGVLRIGDSEEIRKWSSKLISFR